MLNCELKGHMCAWLENEQLLGKTTVEVVITTGVVTTTGVISMNSCVQGSPEQETKSHRLNILRDTALTCKKCSLHRGRKNLVFGAGNSHSSLVFIGEAPGKEEDEKGVPFVGDAGKLLTELLNSVKIDRNKVYITNIIKCRPPGNRDPLPDEISKCYDWLSEQLNILTPSIICTLGRFSTYSLLGGMGGLSFSRCRGKIYEYKGAQVIPTFHPAALLHHPAWTGAVIEDLKLIKSLWGEQ